MRIRSLLPVLVLTVAAVAAGGCGGDDATKAGGSGAPVTLTIGTDDVPGRPASDQVLELVRRVDELSGGTLRLEPVWDADGPGLDDWDQRVARMVVEGELDLGLIPSRAWDTEGVTSLQALNAPFLITSDELLDRVVTGDLVPELLQGLEPAGVVGLALLPEGLRHPFGFGEPLLEQSDFAGATIRAPRSRVVYRLFEALGASVDDPDGPAFSEAVAAGSIDAAESAYALAPTLPGAATATGNVTFFPKVNALVGNAAALERLDEHQSELLEKAARGTVEWAIETRPSDAEAARAFCDAGGAVALAADSEVAAMEAAAAPVVAELERDAATRALIAAIRKLRSEVRPGTTDRSCGGAAALTRTPPTAVAAPTPPQAAQGIPDGVYRTSLTERELVQAGLDASVAPTFDGVNTLTLTGGRIVGKLEEDGPLPPCIGSYASSASTVDITWTRNCDGGLTATWTLDGDMLRLTDVRGHQLGEMAVAKAVFGTKPFRRIR